ncbi:CbiX/SirB N-terminal domain-containing protein [Pseudenhygromyxa sp. WMMC2535]|nr:CbiX/SirB N-terminal domain-containing protein [Pseudenhygromyxa sp. WMMC2535]
MLIAHGSPDPDWRRPLEALRDQLAARIGAKRISLAYLAHPPTVEDAIASLVAAGETQICVIPALLSPGGKHVKRDIPEAVTRAHARFPTILLRLVPGALGSDSRVISALAEASLDLRKSR